MEPKIVFLPVCNAVAAMVCGFYHGFGDAFDDMVRGGARENRLDVNMALIVDIINDHRRCGAVFFVIRNFC